MSRKQQWFWEAYFVLALFFAADNAHLLFQPESQVQLYFTILKSFNPVYKYHYAAHVIRIILTLIHCIPLALFIYNIRILHPNAWKGLFILRCVFELAGRSYETNFLTAQWHDNPLTFAILALIALLTMAPSYYACYQYAFKPWKKSSRS